MSGEVDLNLRILAWALCADAQAMGYDHKANPTMVGFDTPYPSCPRHLGIAADVRSQLSGAALPVATAGPEPLTKPFRELRKSIERLPLDYGCRDAVSRSRVIAAIEARIEDNLDSAAALRGAAAQADGGEAGWLAHQATWDALMDAIGDPEKAQATLDRLYRAARADAGPAR